MRTRHAQESDYPGIIAVLDAWWAENRRMTDMLPRLFFKHFHDTGFVVEQGGAAVAFLIGFISQADPRQAYVHFMGVHPQHRRKGLARALYARFYDAVRRRGCEEVHLLTSPANENSIAFHTRMGFTIEPGDKFAGAVSVHSNYDGPGEDRVLFVKRIAP
jgi:ribosomal protein S18 acetylase RimI-like enzyme